MTICFDLVSPRKRPVIRQRGMECLIDTGAEISVSILSKGYFEENYKIVGEKRIDNLRTANSIMPGNLIVLEKFDLGELTIIGMPILLPDNAEYLKTPIAIGADVFYNCGLDYTVSNSAEKLIVDSVGNRRTVRYSLLER